MALPRAEASSDPGPLQHVRVDVALEIPSDIRYIQRVVQLIAHQCQEMAYPHKHCAINIPVSLSEALSNAILRGNANRRDGVVRVRAHVDPTEMVVEVVDEGSGFDLDACTRDPTADENLFREDGRGLFLMRCLMDRVESYADNGNVVRLTLRRP